MSFNNLSIYLIAFVLPFALMSCSDDPASVDIPDNGNGNGNGNGEAGLVYGIQYEANGGVATFTVDMEDVEGFDPDEHTVFITGSLLGWQEPGDDPDRQTLVRIEDDDTELPIVTPDETGEVEYKYFSDFVAEGWGGGEWDGDPNRAAVLEPGAEINDVWGDQPEE